MCSGKGGGTDSLGSSTSSPKSLTSSSDWAPGGAVVGGSFCSVEKKNAKSKSLYLSQKTRLFRHHKLFNKHIRSTKQIRNLSSAKKKLLLFSCFVFNPYPANIFVLKMSSAYYVCCIYLNSLKTALSWQQTAP